jgi:hypothetical protein
MMTSSEIFNKFIIFVLVAFCGFQLQGFSKNKNFKESPPTIIEFLGDQPMTRINRPFVVLTTVKNTENYSDNFSINLKLPQGVYSKGNVKHIIPLSANETKTIRWTLFSNKELYDNLILEVTNKHKLVTSRILPIRFLSKKENKKNTTYIPQPVHVKKDNNLLIGAHHCPIWKTDAYVRWEQVIKHPGRTPALGFYSQQNSEVSDWETKWAVEHGIDFFIYCWYRDYQGGPVQSRYANVFTDGLFKSKFQEQMKFTIMWENYNSNNAGVDNEADLMENLFPFWMENYFKKPNYLIVDNKPVLFIYRPDNLVDDLGSIENVHIAFEKMREACRQKGFDGLWIMGEYRGVEKSRLENFKNMGMDYTFAYCWPVNNNPTPAQAIYTQMEKIKATQQLGVLPQIVTLSQGWSGWHDESSIWSIPPTEYKELLIKAKDFISRLPDGDLGKRMLLLDNWNEWGEGHYIGPCTEYGFGYLDAVREVFTNAPATHDDLIPEDIGKGPYETVYRKWLDNKRNK